LLYPFRHAPSRHNPFVESLTQYSVCWRDSRPPLIHKSLCNGDTSPLLQWAPTFPTQRSSASLPIAKHLPSFIQAALSICWRPRFHQYHSLFSSRPDWRFFSLRVRDGTVPIGMVSPPSPRLFHFSVIALTPRTNALATPVPGRFFRRTTPVSSGMRLLAVRVFSGSLFGTARKKCLGAP